MTPKIRIAIERALRAGEQRSVIARRFGVRTGQITPVARRIGLPILRRGQSERVLLARMVRMQDQVFGYRCNNRSNP